MDNQITFEQVNDQINKADLKQFQQGGAKHFTAASVAANPGDVLQKVCGIYHTIRSILEWVLKILPAKWKDALKVFMSLMDTLCP